MRKFIVKLLNGLGDLCFDLADLLDHELHEKLKDALSDQAKYEIVPKNREEEPQAEMPPDAKELLLELRDKVLQAQGEGKVVLSTIEGLVEMRLDDLINQPAEGILYDLNRDRPTVLTFLEDPKWINDFAVGAVITKLKSMTEKGRRK